MAALRFPAVNDLIADAADQAGRGARVGLARHCGVQPTSSGRWINRELTPDKRYWDCIEEYFDLPSGSLAAAAGFRTPVPGSYGQRLAELEERVGSLEARLADVENAQAPDTVYRFPRDVSTPAAADHGDRRDPAPPDANRWVDDATEEPDPDDAA